MRREIEPNREFEKSGDGRPNNSGELSEEKRKSSSSGSKQSEEKDDEDTIVDDDYECSNNEQGLDENGSDLLPSKAPLLIKPSTQWFGIDQGSILRPLPRKDVLSGAWVGTCFILKLICNSTFSTQYTLHSQKSVP